MNTMQAGVQSMLISSHGQGHHVYHVAACWALHCSHKGPPYGWATCSPEASWLSQCSSTGWTSTIIVHVSTIFYSLQAPLSAFHDFIPGHHVQHINKIHPPPQGHQGPACPRHAKTRDLAYLCWCGWIKAWGKKRCWIHCVSFSGKSIWRNRFYTKI